MKHRVGTNSSPIFESVLLAIDRLRDSCTYREIYKEGFIQGFTKHYPEPLDSIELECEREWLYFLGEEWLGTPSRETRAKIASISDPLMFEDLVEKIADDRLQIKTLEEVFPRS